MPDEKGVLRPDERDRVVKWFGEKVQKLQPCMACGTNDWLLNPNVAVLLLLSGQSVVLGGPSIPAVVIICQSCGHMEFFSAKRMGLFADESQPAKPASQGAVADAT